MICGPGRSSGYEVDRSPTSRVTTITGDSEAEHRETTPTCPSRVTLCGTPLLVLRELPLDRVGTVHIAEGHWISANRNSTEQRLLDDHLHPVPDAVFSMLEELAALAPQPLTVVLERDGAYPPMGDLLLELQLARAAMRRGRARSETVTERATPVNRGCSGGSSARLEALLARIYVDEPLRLSFLAAPKEFVDRYSLSAEDATVLASIDRTGLTMAARSFARKRQLKRAQQH